MLISNIINDSFGILSKQLRFYCWHFRRDLDQRQRQELIQLLYEQHFERLAAKIRNLNQSSIADGRQQIGKLLFDHCLTRNRRHQLTQLIQSGLVDINVRLDNYGRTLLHRAAYNLDVELVKILIDQNVNIRLRDYAGNTALHIAIQSYRNGALIFGNGLDVVDNLTSIIEALLTADRRLSRERHVSKRMRLMGEFQEDNHASHSRFANTSSDSSEEHHLDTQDVNALGDSSSLCGSPRRKVGVRANSNNQTEPGLNDHNTINYTPKLDSKRNLSICLPLDQRDSEMAKSTSSNQVPDDSAGSIGKILLEDLSCSLIDTKNAFGRTALHYCVLVVGEQHLAHFVKLLISFGADTDVIDSKLKTPLYCLVKRPNVSVVRQKCLAITQLINAGCDDLGLAINPTSLFSEKYIKDVESNISNTLQSKSDTSIEPIFVKYTFKRVPRLIHLARLSIIRTYHQKKQFKTQKCLALPQYCPAQLNSYINRKILDQSELF